MKKELGDSMKKELALLRFAGIWLVSYIVIAVVSTIVLMGCEMPLDARGGSTPVSPGEVAEDLGPGGWGSAGVRP